MDIPTEERPSIANVFPQAHTMRAMDLIGSTITRNTTILVHNNHPPQIVPLQGEALQPFPQQCSIEQTESLLKPNPPLLTGEQTLSHLTR